MEQSNDDMFNALPPDHPAHFYPDVDFAFVDGYQWTDPVWGKAVIDDSWGGIDQDNADINYSEMFIELLEHPAITRLIGIEQLTLPHQYATSPNAARFSRWEHVTGSALFVKQLVEKWNVQNPENEIGNREKVIYMLRTMLSDVGHTVGSHLGDWIMGDAEEKEHDEQLKDYIKQNGIADILKRYDISLDEVILTEIDEDDFVERSSPFLCIDRVDYAVREIHRTNRYFDDPNKRFTIDDFELVKDGSGKHQLVINNRSTTDELDSLATDDESETLANEYNKIRALEFAKAYELLPKEDWSEPLQRLQTTVYTKLVKLVLIAISQGQIRTPVNDIESPHIRQPWEKTEFIYEKDRHPRDILMYAESIIGASIARAYHEIEVRKTHPKMNGKNDVTLSSDDILHIICRLDAIMLSVSELATKYYQNTRQQEVKRFMDDVTENEANPNIQISDRVTSYSIGSDGTGTAGIAINFVAGNSDRDTSDLVFVKLDERKKRVVDPTLIVDGKIQRLSEVSEYKVNTDAYSELSASLELEGPSRRSALSDAAKIIEQEWLELLDRPRIPPRQLQAFQQSTLTALIAGLDYSLFTKEGALGELMFEEDLARARAYAARTKIRT